MPLKSTKIDDVEKFVNETYPDKFTDRVPCGNMCYNMILRIRVAADPREIIFCFFYNGDLVWANYHDENARTAEELEKLFAKTLGDK